MISEKYKEIWLNKPNYLELLKKRMGARNQNLTTLIYAESDTRALVKSLFLLRELCLSEEIDLDTLKKVTTIFLVNDQSRALRYYRMEELAHYLREVIEGLNHVDSIRAYKSLIEEVLFYIGRLNFWIDKEIPWSFLSSVFMER
jgi:hypothetical protein